MFVGTGLIKAEETQGAAEQRSLSEIAACSLSAPPPPSLREVPYYRGRRQV